MKQAGQPEHERVGHVSAAGKQRDELVSAHFLLFILSVSLPVGWCCDLQRRPSLLSEISLEMFSEHVLPRQFQVLSSR